MQANASDAAFMTAFLTLFTFIISMFPMLFIKLGEERGQSFLFKTWAISYAVLALWVWFVYFILSRGGYGSYALVPGAVYALFAVITLSVAAYVIPAQVREQLRMCGVVTELGDKLIGALDVDQDGLVSPKDINAGKDRALRMGISQELIRFLECHSDLVGHSMDDDGSVSAISSSDIATAETRARQKWVKWIPA